MQSSSFQSSVLKKKPALDVIASKKVISHSVSRPSFSQIKEKTNLSHKGLDGIRKNNSLLSELQKRSFINSLQLTLRRSQIYFRRAKRVLVGLLPMAPNKLVFASIASGIAFGMVSMAFIAHVFGPGVFARGGQPEEKVAGVSVVATGNIEESASIAAYDPNQDIFFEYFNEASEGKYEEKVREMVKGYPMEAMLPYIFEQDRMTAAFLIGIGKKESNWGKRVPVLDGQDCFNYWGYRGVRRMMGTGGHTCFNSRKDAVETVAARIEKLTKSEKLNTPEKLIVWKCGFSCDGHSRESVKKWISDVDMYYGQLKDE